MSGTLLAPAELRSRGFKALVDSLGWVNAVRYIQQFERSALDYTRERDVILPDASPRQMIDRLADLEDKLRKLP